MLQTKVEANYTKIVRGSKTLYSVTINLNVVRFPLNFQNDTISPEKNKLNHFLMYITYCHFSYMHIEIRFVIS